MFRSVFGLKHSVFQGYNTCTHQQLVLPVVSPGSRHWCRGQQAARIGAKIHLLLTLFVRACDTNQQPCFLSPPHPVITETKALAAPPLLRSHSVLLLLLNCQVLLS